MPSTPPATAVFLMFSDLMAVSLSALSERSLNS
jgi:hypothetical protein